MEARELDKDLSVLDSIISKDTINAVQLLSFSSTAQEQTIPILNGDWSQLKDILAKTQYDGASFFGRLNSITKKGRTLVFTDGRKTDPDDFLSLDKGDIIINSSSQADHKTLQLWEFLNRVTLLDLSAGQESEKTKIAPSSLKGTVYLDGQPVANVLIRVSNGKSIITDSTGQFRYKGAVGDTLWINTTEAPTRKIVVKDNNDQSTKKPVS